MHIHLHTHTHTHSHLHLHIHVHIFLRCLERFLHGGLRDFGRGHLGEFFERRGGRLAGGRRQ